MKEHNPDNAILHESINGTPTVTPAKVPKKRDHDTMISGFQGDSSASRSFPIPKPVLERDFQMSVQLNPKISVGPGIWGQRNWVSYISGHWNGRWGKGTVVVRSPRLYFLSYSLLLTVIADTISHTAWRPGQTARRARSFYPPRLLLPPPNPRPSSCLHQRQERRMACRPARGA